MRNDSDSVVGYPTDCSIFNRGKRDFFGAGPDFLIALVLHRFGNMNGEAGFCVDFCSSRTTRSNGNREKFRNNQTNQ